MPELPEVETTLKGIAPLVTGKKVKKVIIRESRMRWPIPPELAQELPSQAINSIERRAKYLLFRTDIGTLIMHLGMSGTLCITEQHRDIKKHDHLDLVFEDGTTLCLNDPRRFGAALWYHGDPLTHPLLTKLGPEPLTRTFSGKTLINKAKNRRVAVKSFIMNNHVVVGVGNIYANEALFRSGIDPSKPAGKVAEKKYIILTKHIKTVLREAIKQGGTTLKDFRSGADKLGYFQQKLAVYGREGQPCPNCGKPISTMRIGQRASFFCKKCQK